ncbi:MAG: hypothetical protein E7586_06765 [Ruminococcaceae bacterium]|nr:hypothetical protein [Oscillospiraceae bacterium]
MKDLNNFKDWLIANKKLSKGAISATCARVNRILEKYDVENEYIKDKCAELLEDFTYTTQDAKNGLLPNVTIIIAGSYVKGLASLRNALKIYIEYLDQTFAPVIIKEKRTCCFFEGDVDGFNYFIGPKCRNAIQALTKAAKKKQIYCECCGAKKTLEAAHKEGFERIDIIKNILKSNYEIAPGRYRVDLVDFEKKFKQAHLPLETVFYFLCANCHDVYDGKDSVKSQDVAKRVEENRSKL